ncbi:hypothetical protein CKAH01_18417 [Colletotrichum kahawae]|uniref:Uncharacterized protein n=1 Tax=Colletotrichum kahawae TaxID=34407 RepID=A0AAD9Y6X9_COLKA|nr:hypothetical protein CKAH01_18417 [Colletotrichum kahawae]
MAYVADEAGNILAAVPVTWTCDNYSGDLLILLRSVTRSNKYVDYSPLAAFGF